MQNVWCDTTCYCSRYYFLLKLKTKYEFIWWMAEYWAKISCYLVCPCRIHLIGCSVLMITNLIDKPKWYLYLSILTKQVLQTGFIVDCANWLQMRTGWEMRSRHWHWLQTLIENKISCTKISCSEVSSDWFQRTVLDQGTRVIWRTTWARLATNAWLISSHLEMLQESLYLL